MALAVEQVLRVKYRLPGWEADFGQLHEELRAWLIRIAPHGIGMNWRDDFLCERFVDRMLDFWRGRAYKGVLLLWFDEANRKPDELIDLKPRLANRGFLRRRAVSFWKRQTEARICTQSLDEESRGELPIAVDVVAPPDCPLDAHFLQLLQTLDDLLKNIVLPVPPAGVPSKCVLMGGIQLHPRLDWSCPRMQRLRMHVDEQIHTPDPQERASWVQRLHDGAQASFDLRVNRTAERLIRAAMHSSRMSPEKQARLRDKLDRLRLQRLIQPLDAPAIIGLLAISEDSAHKRLSRYRQELPEMIPVLRSLLRRIGERRYEIQPDRDAESTDHDVQ